MGPVPMPRPRCCLGSLRPQRPEHPCRLPFRGPPPPYRVAAARQPSVTIHRPTVMAPVSLLRPRCCSGKLRPQRPEHLLRLLSSTRPYPGPAARPPPQRSPTLQEVIENMPGGNDPPKTTIDRIWEGVFRSYPGTPTARVPSNVAPRLPSNSSLPARRPQRVDLADLHLLADVSVSVGRRYRPN